MQDTKNRRKNKIVIPVQVPRIGNSVKEKGLGIIMKKVFSFVFAVLISMCAFTACLAEDAYGLYTTVMDSVKDATAIEGTCQMKVNVAAGGMSMGMTIDGNMQMIKRSETDVDMAMNLSMNLGALSGGTTEMSMYIKDGWQYTNTSGIKTKQELSIDTSESESLDPEMLKKLQDSLISFDKSLIVSSKTEKVNGGKKISFELDGQKIYEVYMKLLEESLGEDFDLDAFSGLVNGDLGEDINFALSNVQYSVVADKDNVMREASINLTVETGEDYKIEMQIDLTGLGFDSFTEIDFPDDLDDYSEEGDWFDDLDDDMYGDYNFDDDIFGDYDYGDDFNLFDDMTF